MKKKKLSFSEYMKNSKKMFGMLFGEKLLHELNDIPCKSIKWTGADIDTTDITCCFPNVKERFNENWTKNFNERDESVAFDLFLQTVFHYGYQQATDNNERMLDRFNIYTKEKDLLTIISDMYVNIKLGSIDEYLERNKENLIDILRLDMKLDVEKQRINK